MRRIVAIVIVGLFALEAFGARTTCCGAAPTIQPASASAVEHACCAGASVRLPLSPEQDNRTQLCECGQQAQLHPDSAPPSPEQHWLVQTLYAKHLLFYQDRKPIAPISTLDLETRGPPELELSYLQRWQC